MAQPLTTGERDRLAHRARLILKPSDRVNIRRRDGSVTTFVFDAWLESDGLFLSRTGRTLDALDVIAVNKVATSFRDPPPNHAAEVG